jgi:protein arginine kinase
MIQVGTSLGEQGLEWIHGTGADAEVVLSSRVRVARNLQGMPCPARAGSEERTGVLSWVRGALDRVGSLEAGTLWEIGALSRADREILVERHLISRELLGASETPREASALVLADGSAFGVMVNEEDHLRIQALTSGFELEDAWRRVERLDEEIGEELPLAYHHQFGFLTACPTNVGTGLRASVLIHLPGLVLTKEISKVLDGISQVGLTYRGLYGEGSEVIGNFFQVSNQTTLGKSEEDLIDQLARVAGKVIDYERRARGVLLREAPAVLEDKVWRAYGTLRHARSLSLGELMNLLSGVRLGVSLKLLKTARVETLNEILILGQTAHLERQARGSLDDQEADVFRAAFVRDRLAEDERETGGPPPTNTSSDEAAEKPPSGGG